MKALALSIALFILAVTLSGCGEMIVSIFTGQVR